jgi:hypothetical protein
MTVSSRGDGEPRVEDNYSEGDRHVRRLPSNQTLRQRSPGNRQSDQVRVKSTNRWPVNIIKHLQSGRILTIPDPRKLIYRLVEDKQMAGNDGRTDVRLMRSMSAGESADASPSMIAAG